MTKRDIRPAPRFLADVAAEIARIGDLDAVALRTLWSTWFETPVPARMRKAMLALVFGYRIQSVTLGGLTQPAARTLDAVAAQEFGEATRARSRSVLVKPGTKLVREYHGRVHDVDVVDDGYVWNGTRYRSLSAVARAITGTKWNGLMFFGLRSASRQIPS